MYKYNSIEELTIDKLIEESWQSVQTKVEKGQLLSSEKTLVFLFAMEVVKRINNDSLVIDFEYKCYNGLGGQSKYLDLLFYTSTEYKVAIEFKLPQRSRSGNSNQTQTRKSVYRDLARLKYLNENGYSACYFLMAVNENSYLNNTTIIDEFITKQFHTIHSENNLMASGLSLNGVLCQFNWQRTEKVNNHYRRTGYFAWLKKIRIKT